MIIILAALASRAFRAFAPAVPTPILWSIIGVAVLVNLVIKGRILLSDQAAERALQIEETGTVSATPALGLSKHLSGRLLKRLLPVDAVTLGALAVIIGGAHFLPEQ